MNKTKIEFCNYTINPVKGLCPMACEYCYARAMYKRFKWNPEIRYIGMRDGGPQNLPVESRVFVGSTFELFGDWVKPEWMQGILDYCKMMNRITWIFLTKQPQNLIKFSPYPPNVWLGVSATDNEMAFNASCNLISVEAKVKFISFEPLRGRIGPAVLSLLTEKIKWVIIGAQTPRSEDTFPKWAWVREIIEAADTASIPVFLKPNLGLLEYSCEGSAPFYRRHQSGTWKIRQELPAPVAKE